MRPAKAVMCFTSWMIVGLICRSHESRVPVSKYPSALFVGTAA